MRRPMTALLASASVLCLAVSAAAQGQVPPKRDPQGLKGVSPFWEAVSKGDAAYIARDFDGAIAAYREAIQSDPQNAMGHYRIGSAHLAKGDLREAEAAWVSALRFSTDNAMKSKVLFVLADLRERQKAWDDAVDRWNAYEQHSSRPEANAYPATPMERKKRIAEWKKVSEEAQAVKARIERRLQEGNKGQ